MRLKTKLNILAIIAAGLLALLAGTCGYRDAAVADRWVERLENALRSKVNSILRSIAALDLAGIPALVRALSSQREEIVTAADKTLNDEMTSLRLRDLDYWSPRAVVLGRALQKQAENFGPAGRESAADLSRRLLQWSQGIDFDDREELLVCCDRVLRVASAGRVYSDRARLAPNSPRAGGNRNNRSERTQDALASIANRDSRSPGSQPAEPTLPLEPAERLEASTAPIESDDSPIEIVEPTTPRPFLPEGRPLLPIDEPSNPRKLKEPARLDKGNAVPFESPRGVASRSDNSLRWGRGKRVTEQPIESVSDFANRDVLDLVHDLAAAKGPAAKTIRAELRRRGLTERELALAPQFSSRDPNVRVALAKALPTMREVHASRWLLWLARDENADVRFAAMSLLATSGDPKIVLQVRELAREDRDPRIRSYAKRLARRSGRRPGR